MADSEAVAGSQLTDWISLGVLTSFVPRDAVDEAIEATGAGARRSDTTIPPQVVAYFVMALALFADDDYETVARRLAATLTDLDVVGPRWEPTSSGLTKARQRLGAAPLAELFGQVAGPVADLDTVGAFLSRWRLMSIDGLEWDAPASKENIAAFGLPAGRVDAPGVLPKVRAVTVSECASHAPVLAAFGPAGGAKPASEQALARTVYPRLASDWLLLADRNFYSWADWCTAADTGAALLWRVKATLRLPPLRALSDGSYLTVLVNPKVTGKARETLVTAARAGAPLDPTKARYTRLVEYDVPDREGDGKHEITGLLTTICDPREATATALAGAYRQRWEHEVAIEDAKQLVGVGQARNRLATAAQRAVPFGLTCQTLAFTWYLTTGHHHDDAAEHRARAPWYTTKTRPSTADLLAKHRRVLIATKYQPAHPEQPTPAEIHTLRLAWEITAA
ncbi:IS4 family transposase [Frankia sp. B2]|uniref:Transposase IS4 N-terminal domain-containing protein n=2 Tax=Frankia casuarinae (strain DSM 45818 / CECT 9043 / HFP020203 / CcI3) TaxID=106370 RepID=Q2J8F5_FRACC|nr:MULTISPECIES: IS4 family transposase [Frankia]ABD12437.1 hypothetical protein Francci3_3080 [Frankia casuarinae]KEZ36424.1 Insertion element 4 transposase N-terminal [Frankia sp. CeD]TFE33460.1 IS4 family transposase [Frankia sp. B2]